MRLVVDANVAISAIIRDSVTRRLLFHPALSLYSPAYLFDELEEHKDEIMKKAGLDTLQFKAFTTLLGRVITVVPSTAYAQYVEDARKVISDPDDLPYAALAIALSVSRPGLPETDVVAAIQRDGVNFERATVYDVDECGIWSNDPHFTRKEPELLKNFGVQIWTTKSLHKLMSV